MCGIVGVIHQKSLSDSFERRTLGAMELLSHRGPDGQGLSQYPSPGEFATTFGHKRLSIIDLSEGGAQPMTLLGEKFGVVFNGEIYNYRELREKLATVGCTFRTESDTEVLLHAWKVWGEKALSKLEGMFSFAIHDFESGSLTLVRDAFGIKPLFYSKEEDSFAFGSEPMTLLKLRGIKATPNLRIAKTFLENGSYDKSAQTFFEGIFSVLPGQLIKVTPVGSRLNVSETQWYSPKFIERKITRGVAAAEIRGSFLDAVKLNMRSDVPIGATLSGGLDSTAVVAAMRLLEPDLELKTFSFVSPGNLNDESSWSSLAATDLGVQNFQVSLQPLEFGKDMENLIRAQGEPFGTTSIYAQYKVFERASQEGITVTLDGQGADEVFAGYHGFPDARFRSLAERHKYRELFDLTKKWASWPNRDIKWANLIAAQSVLLDLQKRFPLMSVLSAPRALAAHVFSKQFSGGFSGVWNPDFPVQADEGPPLESESEYFGRRLIEQLSFSLGIGNVTQLLRHSDRSSMYWSIESRVPFLTHKLIGHALSLPEEYLLGNDGETKSIFREAMRGIVPDKIRERRDKIGFEAPNKSLPFREEFGLDRMREAISSIPVLNQVGIKSLVSDRDSSSDAHDWRLFRVWNYIKWWEQFSVTVK